MTINLNDLDRSWGTQLTEYDYAGEIALTKPDYKAISEHYADFVGRYSGTPTAALFRYKNVLVVLAVNCAYFEYNEFGFWTHFFKRIRLDYSLGLQGSIGQEIEDFLMMNGFLSERRAGAFRYVGAILEQCGITRRYLPRFAEILNRGVLRYGWAAMSSLSTYQYKSLIPEEGISAYLRNFLLDSAGKMFFEAVARSFDQASRMPNPIDYLTSLRGFRPSFWLELEKQLGKVPPTPPPKGTKKLKHPELLYQPRQNRLVLMCDNEAVRETQILFRDEVVDSNVIELATPADFENAYFFMLKLRAGEYEKVTVPGWSLNERDYSFFNVDDGSLIPDFKGLSEDEYFLVIKASFIEGLPGEQRECFEEAIIDDYFYLSPPVVGLLGYRVYLDSKLDFLVPVDTDRVGRLISWASASSIFDEAVEQASVFYRELPRVKIHDPELFKNQDFLLFYDCGSGRKQIDSATIRDSIKLEISSPAEGEIWAEPVGRRRGPQTEPRLQFCLLPDFSILWPDWLLSHDEELKIEIRGDDRLEMSLMNGEMDESNPRAWKIPASVDFVNGTIRRGEVSVRIGKKLARAKLSNKRMHRLGVIELNDMLSIDELFMEGIPNSTAKVYLLDPGQKIHLADIGTFSRTGTIMFRPAAIGAALKSSEFSVGHLGIQHSRGVATTGCKVFRSDEIIRKIESGKPYDPGKLLPPHLADPLNVFDLLVNKPGYFRQCHSDTAMELPDKLRDWGEEILKSAHVFDDVDVDGEEFNISGDTSMDRSLAMIKRAKSYLRRGQGYDREFNAKDYARKIEQETWKPRLERWQKLYEEVISSLKDQLDLLDLLEQWSMEVSNEETLPEYQSKIARMPYGRELTSAWIRFRRGNHAKSYARAKKVIESTSGIVSDLAWALILVMATKGLIHLENPSKYITSENEMAPVIDYLTSRLELPSKLNELVINLESQITLAQLPLPSVNNVN
jgi:hypothetical protein